MPENQTIKEMPENKESSPSFKKEESSPRIRTQRKRLDSEVAENSDDDATQLRLSKD